MSFWAWPMWYRQSMHRTICIFSSFEDAEAATRAEYRAMTPRERVDLVLRLVADYHGWTDDTAPRLERVLRVLPGPRS
jgi:hypothetical protein